MNDWGWKPRRNSDFDFVGEFSEFLRTQLEDSGDDEVEKRETIRSR